MAYADDLHTDLREPALRRALSGVLRLLTARAAPDRTARAARADLAATLAPEALIDADVARMASFGSWSALREELRARDQTARKTAA